MADKKIFLGTSDPRAVASRLRAGHDVAEEAAQLLERSHEALKQIAALIPERTTVFDFHTGWHKLNAVIIAINKIVRAELGDNR